MTTPSQLRTIPLRFGARACIAPGPRPIFVELLLRKTGRASGMCPHFPCRYKEAEGRPLPREHPGPERR